MIDLSKGSRINLSKEAPGATKFILGMGWDARKTDGSDFDLDASALLLGASEKPVGGPKSLVFYGQQTSPCGGVASSGDNLTGEGDGDDVIARYDLSEDYSTETAVIFGELYKKDGDWRFAAKGDGFAGGLAAFLKEYGLQ